MHSRRFLLTGCIYLIVFFFQLMLIDQFHLPYGGFSLFLIFALCWSALSSPEVGAISGFAAGVFLDLSPSSTSPVGLWMLVMSAVGFGIALPSIWR
ncbi:MAG: rod shape-determining protein MreD [Actinomycetota bacterium]